MGMNKRIAQARNAKGWSQSELARLVGVSYTSVQNWEDIKDPTEPRQAKRKKLSEVLQVTESWLLTGVGEPDRASSEDVIQELNDLMQSFDRLQLIELRDSARIIRGDEFGSQ